MATLSKTTDGRWIIQFRAPRTKRRETLSLGAVSKATAREIHSHVCRLIEAVASHTSPPLATAEWKGIIGDALHADLVRVGLGDPRITGTPRTITIAKMCDDYIRRRTDVKERTRTILRHVRATLIEHFTKDKDIGEINQGDGEDWRRFLLTKLAKATVSLHVKKARQFFADAVSRGIIKSNPLAKVKAGKQTNADRLRYVPAVDIEQVIEECPDHEWRLVFALARYGGLRIPSELGLTVGDVDWSRSRLTIRSPKTAHHDGRDKRIIPIFPELLPHLRAACEAVEPGEKYLLPRLRRRENLGTNAARIIERAGLAVWPKVFQNLRSSRETDLTMRYPLHVVCAWIGNTQAVAIQHYLQVTDEHFASASAVHGAASGDEKSRTIGERANQNLSVLPSDAPFRLPPVGVQQLSADLKDLQVLEPALRKALQRAHSRLHRFYESSTRKLERHLRKARRGTL